MFNKFLFIFILCQSIFLGQKTWAQNNEIDSLKILLQNAKEDTNKVILLNLLSKKSLISGAQEDFFKYAQTANYLAKKLEYQKGLANSYGVLGLGYFEQGKYPQALKNQLAALKIRESISDKMGMADSYNNIGNVHFSLHNYDEALSNHFKALKLRTNIGLHEDAFISYLNIGNVYYMKKNYAEALKNYSYILEGKDSPSTLRIRAYAFNNIGVIHKDQGNFKEALKNHFEALKIREKIEDKYGLALSYGNIGAAYKELGEYKEGEIWLHKSVKVGKELKAKDVLKDAHEEFSKFYSAIGNYKSALENYKIFIIYRDSLFNEQNIKELTQATMQFDFDKKETIAKAQQEKKDAIAKQEIQKQKLVRNGFIGGLLLVLFFATFMYNRYKVTQHQKTIIEEKEKETHHQNKIITQQKLLVEEKNREIVESIEYALRIQTAILPPRKIVKQCLENSFILYKPKDIVAGDFYWMETVQLADENSRTKNQLINSSTNQLILFAACDCTGHGVPGAMVSVVCHNALNRAVREFGLTQPSLILDKVTEIVLENFSKSEEDIKDGMDISLCAYHTKTNTLQWAGANNPLWLIQNGELIETKANKQPVGLVENRKPFTNHTFYLKPNTTIYLFTDGYADQFGGETSQKKLTKKRFRELILSIQNKPIYEQELILDNFITNYRKKIEQIDDILVMGVSV